MPYMGTRIDVARERRSDSTAVSRETSSGDVAVVLHTVVRMTSLIEQRMSSSWGVFPDM